MSIGFQGRVDGRIIRTEIAMRDLCLLRMTIHRLTDGVVMVVPMVCRGDVAGEIGDLAMKIGADLVVMVAHERSRWERARDGSIGNEVACQCDCPVLAVEFNLRKSTQQERDDMRVCCSMCLN